MHNNFRQSSFNHLDELQVPWSFSSPRDNTIKALNSQKIILRLNDFNLKSKIVHIRVSNKVLRSKLKVLRHRNKTFLFCNVANASVSQGFDFASHVWKSWFNALKVNTNKFSFIWFCRINLQVQYEATEIKLKVFLRVLIDFFLNWFELSLYNLKMWKNRFDLS